MAQSPIMAAIQQICQEKNISPESVLETIEAALAAAYRKDFGQKNQNIKVEYDPESGASKIFDVKTVVEDELKAKAEAEAEERAAALERGEELPERPELEEGEEEELRYNPKLHISLTDAQELKKGAEVGEEIRVELQPPVGYGRMAAQTAKQVIIQRIREAERNTIFDEFKDKQGQVLIGTVQRRDGPNFLVDLGRATGILPLEEQVDRERYNFGERIRVYLIAVEMGGKGPELVLSRRRPEIVRELFFVEIPEVANNSIEIKGIAREAGFRSKVAVYTDEENIDPIGSCVGQRGTRVQTIINELGGEKIDIIEWSDNAAEFVTHAMLPAKVLGVEIDEGKKTAAVNVGEDQLSLAIGKNGQNVRLATQLTGYQINIIEIKDGQKREVNVEDLAEAEKPEAADGPGQKEVSETGKEDNKEESSAEAIELASPSLGEPESAKGEKEKKATKVKKTKKKEAAKNDEKEEAGE